MAQVSDAWERDSPYEQYIGRWSRRVAPLFLSWLEVPAGRRWLDVGCGTGALCAAILDGCSPASVAGVEPSDGFRATATQNLGDRASLLDGHASSVPLALARSGQSPRARNLSRDKFELGWGFFIDRFSSAHSAGRRAPAKIALHGARRGWRANEAAVAARVAKGFARA